jgi:hypothetical protein
VLEIAGNVIPLVYGIGAGLPQKSPPGFVLFWTFSIMT